MILWDNNFLKNTDLETIRDDFLFSLSSLSDLSLLACTSSPPLLSSPLPVLLFIHQLTLLLHHVFQCFATQFKVKTLQIKKRLNSNLLGKCAKVII
jgi:hypothetical protein